MQPLPYGLSTSTAVRQLRSLLSPVIATDLVGTLYRLNTHEGGQNDLAHFKKHHQKLGHGRLIPNIKF